MKFIIIVLFSLMSWMTSNAQASILKISSEIKLAKDSLISKQLITSLDKFLVSAQIDAKKNAWVYPEEFLQTSLLLDEIVNIQKNNIEEDSVYYKPHLLDISLIENEKYRLRISYLGLLNQAPILRANIELIAHKVKNKFLFSSPLVRNTKDWKSIIIENITFYYQDTMNIKKAKAYKKLRAYYDNKLNIKPKKVLFYLVKDDLTSQEYFGLAYKSDYNGRGNDISWSVLNDMQEIYTLNTSRFTEFDPHDLWHNRLSQLVSRRDVNHAVDEGIATLYGGSWGIDWKGMFVEFEKQIKFNENTDWLILRANKMAFITDGHRNPTDFMVNALFVKKMDTEKGFSAVWELLNAKEEALYFETLEKHTGITKKNYNKEVWKLIQEELKLLNI